MAADNQRVHEEILSLVNSDICVSYRYLANLLDITFDNSKALLNEFKNKFSESVGMRIESVACLALNRGSNIEYVLVPGFQLGEYKASLDGGVNVVTEFVYSIFRNSNSSTMGKEKVNIVYEQMKQTDLTQAKELLLVQGPVTPSSFLLNSEKKGGIIDPTVSCKPVGQKQLIVKVVSNNLKDSVVESAEEHIARMFANRTKSAHTDKKKITSAASFFGSSSNSQSKPKEEKKPTPLAKAKAADLNDEEEWDDGDGYKVSKDNLKKRKTAEEELAEQRLPKMDSNAAGGKEDEALVDDDDDDGKTATPSKKARTIGGKKAAAFVHGAMDDYFEDVAVENHINTISSLADGQVIKKKKKKLIEKTVVDAEGYLVTKYEEEEVTDDEPTPVKKPVAPKAAPAAKPAVKTAAAAAGGAKPKGMMSFFSAVKK